MQNFISAAGGYLTNPDATVDCRFCSARTTDQFLFRSFNIEYTHRWRNLGIVLGVTVFNVSFYLSSSEVKFVELDADRIFVNRSLRSSSSHTSSVFVLEAS